MVHLLGPLVAKIIYHIKNSKNLAEELSEVDIDPWDMLFSHGVVSLFTNTPIPQMIDIIQGRLKSDKTLKQRTLLEVDDIIEMMTFVLNTTYFSFKGQIYQQMFGTTNGQPGITHSSQPMYGGSGAEIYCQCTGGLQAKVLKNYVDDILKIIKSGSAEKLTSHWNSRSYRESKVHP